MIFLVTGGAASGKSEYAEKLACRLSAIDGGPLIYLATMQPAGDPETAARIRRHQCSVPPHLRHIAGWDCTAAAPAGDSPARKTRQGKEK